MSLRLAVVFLFLFVSPVFSQVGIESNFWEWSEKSEHHKSVVKIVHKTPPVTHQGTGVVIGEHQVLTAAHVVDDPGGLIYVEVNGKPILGIVSANDAILDICLITTKEKIELPFIKIAPNAPNESDSVEICGFGGGGDLRHFKGVVKIYSGHTLGVDAYVIPGDSGGPVLNSNHELIGIVSGGMSWSIQKKVKADDSDIAPTWPIRCGSLDGIKNLTGGK